MPDEIPAKRSGGAPLRSKPADFRDQFTRLGWDVVDHYSTSWKVVARWVNEEGRESLQADRKAYRQMLALQSRFVAIIDSRSAVIPADFIAYVVKHASAITTRQNALCR